MIGPLIALALVGWIGLGARSIFLISGIPGALAALLILTVRERRTDAPSSATPTKFSLAGTTPEYKRLLLVTAVFGIANSANAFLILRSQQSWTRAQMDDSRVHALQPGGIARGVACRSGQRSLRQAQRLDHRVSGLRGQLCRLWRRQRGLARLAVVCTVRSVSALTEGAGKALAVDTAGTAGRATVIGIYAMVTGITEIAASYIGGVLWDKIDSRATFYFGAGLAVIAVFLSFALLPSAKRATELKSKRS